MGFQGRVKLEAMGFTKKMGPLEMELSKA